MSCITITARKSGQRYQKIKKMDLKKSKVALMGLSLVTVGISSHGEIYHLLFRCWVRKNLLKGVKESEGRTIREGEKEKPSRFN